MTDGVIVTGSSTGLGLETALGLAANGFRVYAGVRDLASAPAVRAAAAERGVSVDVVALDLTDRASIGAVVDRVVAETGGVFALVNNGGIGLRGCVEDVTPDEIRRVFEVNVFGTIAMTQACCRTCVQRAGGASSRSRRSAGGSRPSASACTARRSSPRKASARR